jgi:hypothetical protein
MKTGAGEAIRTPDPNLGKIAQVIFGGIRGYPLALYLLDFLIFTLTACATAR